MRNKLLVEKITHCRLCAQSQSSVEVVTLKGFPKAAQFLPSINDFDKDISISLEVVECIYCGLVQLTNDPVDYYKDVITAASLTGASRENLVNEFKTVLESFHIEKLRALDIGAGTGQFLTILTELGFAATGLEHNNESVTRGLSQGLVMKQGYLLDNGSFSESFSLITCNNFLEHQPDTGSFLKRIHTLLANNGLLYISVPNLQRIVDEACFYEFVADHLVYFSKKSLRIALELSGFQVCKVYLKNNKNDIVVLAQKRPSLNITNKIAKMDTIVNSVKILVNRLSSEGKKVSIWGAGHRALALMALADLNKIDFVIDSAPFKQGRFTPLLNKEIVDPDYFFSSQTCDCLIVMLPGSLSSQVKEYLKNKNFKGIVVYFKDNIINLKE